MKKKINRQLIFISVLAVGITLLMMAAVFYRIFQIQVIEDLRLFTHALAQSGETEVVMLSADRMEEKAQEEVSGTVEAEKEMSEANVSEADKADGIGDSVRITLISAAGQVLYDSNASTGGMDNHAERPEVRDALKNGEGYSIRQSSTMRKNTFYYTMRLEDGNVLRVAREAHSLWSILYRSVPALMAAVCALLALCMFLSHYLTKSLLMPIERMAVDMDCMEEQDVYEELRPFSRTIRRQHEAILKNADVRQEFSANVSHELKTPIALIQGYAEGLKEGVSDDAESREFYCDVIMDEAAKMNQMVKNLLTLNQLEFGDKDIVFERFDLTALVCGILQSMEILAEQEEIRVIFRQEEPVYVWADEFKVEQVVRNYVSNAFHHAGGEKIVEIKIRTDGGKARVTVFNTGKPVADEDLEHIWEKFYKADKAHSREYGGNGIGLSIVKAIMESFHEKYGVNNYDNGVEFWFELDVQ